MPATYTPIRYPGGKTKLYSEVRSILTANNLLGCTYAEAFAGGAGLACKLLLNDDASRIVINDIDRAVYCMWNTMINHADKMCNFIETVDLNIQEWKNQRLVFQQQADVSDYELGCAAFYLNRTNRSGILSGGVIGGLQQNGSYKLDARFNRKTLQKKIQALARVKDRIDIYNLDAEEFIQKKLPSENTFAYFDPPYVQKGPGLYKNSFDDEKHRSLAKQIARCECAWMITYDDDILIDEIYGEFDRRSIDIRYSAYSASIGKEKMILKPGLNNPFKQSGISA